MKEYILNETPIRTTNNYDINDIKLELDEKNVNFKEFDNANNVSINATDKVQVNDTKIVEGEFISKINLPSDKYYSTIFDIPAYSKENVEVSLLFDKDNNTYVGELVFNVAENAESRIVIKCNSKDSKGNEDNKKLDALINLKVVANLDKNSVATVIVENNISDNTNTFISIENNLEENAKLYTTTLDLSGKNKVSNIYTKLIGDNSEQVLRNIYLGKENDLLDLNYHVETIGKKSKIKIESKGAITDKAKKSFKGTIDFKKGSVKADGREQEDCVLLSKESRSKSLPMLLCHEEDVFGEHGVSSGKIDSKKLFYLMTRGLDEKEAKKTIIRANFNEIINSIEDEELQEKINQAVDEIIK